MGMFHTARGCCDGAIKMEKSEIDHVLTCFWKPLAVATSLPLSSQKAHKRLFLGATVRENLGHSPHANLF
jgi:hypothetical protein